MMTLKTGLLILIFANVLLGDVVPQSADQDSSILEQWVVAVPEGPDRAKRLAEAHDLNFLGEVIPDTNLFHLSAKEHHRLKRSVLNDIHLSLAKHPDINEVHPQSEVLKRVRRIPVEIESRHERQTLDKNVQKLCFISTLATSEKDSRRCVFPFSFKGKTYFQCTKDETSNGKEWCATEVDKNGEVVHLRWGDCDPESVKCFVVGSVESAEPANSGPRVNPRPPAPPPRRPPPPPRSQLPARPGGLPAGFFPPGSSIFGGSFRPEQLPPLRQLPVAPHRQHQGNLPPREFPMISDLRNLLDLNGLNRNEVFPPEKDNQTLIDLADQLTMHFNDKAWPYMWFLNRGGKGSRGLDMNVDEAWAEGVTGEGVVVSILDDGIEWSHPDLEANYDKEASTDLNDNDRDPFPRYDIINSNKHGTRCAGTVAAVANNSICAVGIAYKSKVGGIRILDGNILDVLEAKALSFNRDHIDIYSASWGPDDNGQTVDGPGTLAKMALRDGVEKGRQGKGSIFVWASGNGGKYKDNCNCDGYTTSIYTLSVSSVSEYGTIPWYSESCSSSLATTYSSGSKGKSNNERKVVTTDLHGQCTNQHTGTSASSPMAAGLVALALEANPELTWRDIQHIVVRTARPKGNLKAKDWKTNGVGLSFSHSYGFGLMDAGAMVKLAKKWKTVPVQMNCTTEREGSVENPAVVGAHSDMVFELDASKCSQIAYLEHIKLHAQLSSSSRRGDISLHLLSPVETPSTLLGERPFDDIRTGLSLFSKWPMMSVHFWGESVTSPTRGNTWKLLVKNSGEGQATLHSWMMTFFGTKEDPQPDIPIEQSTKNAAILDSNFEFEDSHETSTETDEENFDGENRESKIIEDSSNQQLASTDLEDPESTTPEVELTSTNEPPLEEQEETTQLHLEDEDHFSDDDGSVSQTIARLALS